MSGKLSEKYYIMYGGGCRHVKVTKNGKMDEFPYDFSEAKLCKRKGEHPHFPKDISKMNGKDVKIKRRDKNAKRNKA